MAALLTLCSCPRGGLGADRSPCPAWAGCVGSGLLAEQQALPCLQALEHRTPGPAEFGSFSCTCCPSAQPLAGSTTLKSPGATPLSPLGQGQPLSIPTALSTLPLPGTTAPSGSQMALGPGKSTGNIFMPNAIKKQLLCPKALSGQLPVLNGHHQMSQWQCHLGLGFCSLIQQCCCQHDAGQDLNPECL